MEKQKIYKEIEVNNLSGSRHPVNINIRFETPVLKSSFL